MGPNGVAPPPATGASGDDEPVPLASCTLPGTITLTPATLDLARRFGAAIPAGWIVAFGWHDWSGVRASKDAFLVETGPGLDLGAYRLTQVPEQAIYHAGSFRYAVVIRREIVASHPRKMIDLDEKGRVDFR